jgi:hypothetical protein
MLSDTQIRAGEIIARLKKEYPDARAHLITETLSSCSSPRFFRRNAPTSASTSLPKRFSANIDSRRII